MKLNNRKFIQNWEGLRLEAYMPTPNDKPTIGWGHTIDVRMGDIISREQAEKFFTFDVRWAVSCVNAEVKVGLTQNQFDAIVSIVFNIGATNFGKSTLLRKLNKGDYDGASQEFGRWVYQGKKVLKGLVRRRAAEQELFLKMRGDIVSVGPAPTSETSSKPAVEPMKALIKSVEGWAGVTTTITGVIAAAGGVFEGFEGYTQAIIATGLVAAGLIILFNRLRARRTGIR